MDPMKNQPISEDRASIEAVADDELEVVSGGTNDYGIPSGSRAFREKGCDSCQHQVGILYWQKDGWWRWACENCRWDCMSFADPAISTISLIAD